jgi:murein DD-endopeptidase MepM/ murein hydrolase activator NlpD
MKIGRHKRVFSIILVPPGGGKPRSFSFGKKQMLFAGIAAGVLLVLFVVSVTALGRMGRFSVAIARLKRENTKLREERQKLAELENEFIRLRAVEGKLLSLLGMENKKNDQKLTLSSAGMLTQGFTQQPVSSGKTPTLWPVRGQISRGFSNEPGGHKGCDIAVQKETPVRAAGEGVVEFAGEDAVFGNMVIINHGSGISTLYGHNSRLTVLRGDSVKKGQIIAYSGNSGNSSAPHLHFEISRNGRQVDPLTFLSEQ